MKVVAGEKAAYESSKLICLDHFKMIRPMSMTHVKRLLSMTHMNGGNSNDTCTRNNLKVSTKYIPSMAYLRPLNSINMNNHFKTIGKKFNIFSLNWAHLSLKIYKLIHEVIMT
jgi:hypothetical protein